MGLQAGASTAARAGSEARGSEGGTMAAGRDEGPGGGAREAGTGEGASAAGRAAGPGRVSLLPEGGAPEVRGPTLPRAPRCGPGSRWAARVALRGASYLCCPCLCRPPSCCGAVAGERPVAKLGHGVLTPSSSAASRPWRMGGSESRGKETLGRGSGEGTLRARAPPAPARTLWRSEARSVPATPLAASVASAYSAQYQALNPDFSGIEEVFNNKVRNPSFPMFLTHLGTQCSPRSLQFVACGAARLFFYCRF